MTKDEECDYEGLLRQLVLSGYTWMRKEKLPKNKSEEARGQGKGTFDIKGKTDCLCRSV